MKLFCFFLCLFALNNIQAQNSPAVQSTVESILLGRASGIQPLLGAGFELEINGQARGTGSNSIAALQAFLDEHPCRSLQVTNPGGNPARGDYRANDAAYWVTIYYNGAKLTKIIISPK